jgi:hypothetical protein
MGHVVILAPSTSKYDKLFDSIKGGVFLDKLSDYQFLKENSASWF